MIQLIIIKPIRRPSTIFSLSEIFLLVKKRIPSTRESVPQAMLGNASASLIAGAANVMKLERIFLIASSTPIRSFVEPILIAKVVGKVAPDAFVFCRPKNAGNRKNAVSPIAINE